MNSALNSPLAEQAQAQIDAINNAGYVTQSQTDGWYLIKTSGAGIQSVNGQVLFLSAITLAAAPTLGGHAVNKNYVDNLINPINNTLTALTDAVNQLQSDVATLQSNDTDLYGRIADLNAQIGTINGTIASIQNDVIAIEAEQDIQNQTITDLNQRVTALENEAGRGGSPFIGNIVHLRDANDHCQPAIVYEDWDGKNAPGVVSVVVIQPERLSMSEWFSKIEVHPEVGIEVPLTAWHWPETSFTRMGRLFARLT